MEQITLRSSDGEEFVVDLKVARLSTTLSNLADEGLVGETVPLLNVSGSILSKVIEYCKKHSEAAAGESLKDFDTEFTDVDQATLLALMLAANYLDIKGLLNLTCQCVADMIKGKSPEEIRETFNVKDDLNSEAEEEEEEEEVRVESEWAAK